MTTSENFVVKNGNPFGMTGDVRVVTDSTDDSSLPLAEEMVQDGGTSGVSDTDVLIVGRPNNDHTLHEELRSAADDVVIIDVDDDEAADIPMAEYLDDGTFHEGDVLDLTTNQLFSADNMPSAANALADMASAADVEAEASPSGCTSSEPIENA
jgi:hypothetical protein